MRMTVCVRWCVAYRFRGPALRRGLLGHAAGFSEGGGLGDITPSRSAWEGQEACALRVVRSASGGGGAAVVTARFCWAPVEGATNPPRLICPQDCAVKTCQAPWRQWLSFPC